MAAIHIINPFLTVEGGAQQRALFLFELLSREHEVYLWSEYDFHSEFAGRYPIRRIRQETGQFPKGGTLVFVGAYFNVGNWLSQAKPRRVVIIFNTPNPVDLHSLRDATRRCAGLEADVVFTSQTIRDLVPEVEGVCQGSIIDLERFTPNPLPKPRFTVGKMNRDNEVKHHPTDPQLYASFIDEGFRVRAMGAKSIEETLPVHPDLQILAAGAEPPEQFLNSLDAFVYRVNPDWMEAFGRVVLEAMACGLPVVAESRNGYTDVLKHGRGGYLFEDESEILPHLRRLRDDPELYREQSQTAAQVAREFLSEEHVQGMLEFFTR